MQKALAPLPHAFGSAAGQAQAPAAHCWPPGQIFPQPPQFCPSVWKLVQKPEAPLPQASGSAAGQPHVPLAHCWPPGQTLPQVWQLFTSVWRSAQYEPPPPVQTL